MRSGEPPKRECAGAYLCLPALLGPGSAPHSLRGLGEVTATLWASVSPSVKWGEPLPSSQGGCEGPTSLFQDGTASPEALGSCCGIQSGQGACRRLAGMDLDFHLWGPSLDLSLTQSHGQRYTQNTPPSGMDAGSWSRTPGAPAGSGVTTHYLLGPGESQRGSGRSRGRGVGLSPRETQMMGKQLLSHQSGRVSTFQHLEQPYWCILALYCHLPREAGTPL